MVLFLLLLLTSNLYLTEIRRYHKRCHRSQLDITTGLDHLEHMLKQEKRLNIISRLANMILQQLCTCF